MPSLTSSLPDAAASICAPEKAQSCVFGSTNQLAVPLAEPSNTARPISGTRNASEPLPVNESATVQALSSSVLEIVPSKPALKLKPAIS